MRQTDARPVLADVRRSDTLKSGSRFVDELDEDRIRAVWEVSAGGGKSGPDHLHGIGFEAVERASHRPSFASTRLSLPVCRQAGELASFSTLSVVSSTAVTRTDSSSTSDRGVLMVRNA